MPTRSPLSREDNERELVSRLRQSEPAECRAAQEVVVRSYGKRLLVVAARFVGPDEAPDMVQEAFLKAFQSIGTFQGASQLSSWLHRILVNTCLMRLRKPDRRSEVSLKEYLPKFNESGHRVDVGPSWPELPDEILAREEIRVLVRASIDRLPATYRVVLFLRDIDGHDTAQTAELLGVTVTAVKLRLHRARQALREIMNPHFQGQPNNG